MLIETFYIAYKCKGCSKEVILLTEEMKRTIAIGKYIACPHCGCKKLTEINQTDDLRECMKARKYKRNSNGAIQQY